MNSCRKRTLPDQSRQRRPRSVILPGAAASRRTSDNSPRYVTVGEAQRRVDAPGAATLHNVYCRMSGGNGQKPFVRRVSPGSDRNWAVVRRWLLLMAVTGDDRNRGVIRLGADGPVDAEGYGRSLWGGAFLS